MNFMKILENRRKEKEKKEKVEIAKKVAAGAAAGMVAGTVSGILIAPKSGKQTREELAKTAKDLTQNVKTKKIEIQGTVNKIIGKVENKASETKYNISDAKDKIAKYLVDKKRSKKYFTSENVAVEEEIKEIKDQD